jgi:hypothetical protein
MTFDRCATLVGALVAALLAGGCASGAATSGAARPAVATVPTIEAEVPAEVTLRAPRESGLNSVIGERAERLIERLGQTRIDLTEGNARKLQFAGERCVLDIYLYPIAEGFAPVATHVEARLRQDGQDTDRTACIAEVGRHRARW